MIFGNNTQDTRAVFYSSWEKYQQTLPLTSLEQQIVQVMLDHPAYQSLFAQPANGDLTAVVEQGAAENPFLHMGLHLAIRDQIALNRPEGIAGIAAALHLQYTNMHEVEHLLMEQLAQCLWAATRQQRLPNERSYLKACQELLSK
jgi:hypothetical protein